MRVSGQVATRLRLHPGLRIGVCLGVCLCVCLGLRATPAMAQSWGPRAALDDAAYTAFGRRDGLPDGPILSLTVGRDGRLLLGTSDGARRLDGRQWTRLPSPPAQKRNDVRMLLERANGERVQVASFGVNIQRGDAWVRHILLPDSLGPIYSAVLFPGPDGAETVYLGGKGGVLLIDAQGRVQRVPLPTGMVPDDAMLTVHRDRDTLELWVGTRGGGVARRRGDAWQRWGAADGLTNDRVEQVVLAPPGDSARAIAATEQGAFLLVGDRWHAFGPRESIARALRVPVRRGIETWLGTLGGELLRSRDDVHFEALDVAARIRGSRVQVLTRDALDDDEPMVYAGFRSGVLLRFRIGVAGRVLLPAPFQGRPVSAMAPSLDAGGIWTWMLGVGAVRLPDLARVPVDLDVIGGGDGRIRLMRAPRGGPLLATSEWRLYEADGGRWHQRLSAPARGYLHKLMELPDERGELHVHALAGYGGFRRGPDGRWIEWPDTTTALHALLRDTLTDRVTLLAVRADRRVLRGTIGAWRSEPGPPMPLRGVPSSALLWRLPSGECALLVGLSDGLALRRTCGGAPTWRTFTIANLPGLSANEVMDLAQLPDGRLAAATSRGLVLLRAGARFDDGLTVDRTITDADGLPHANINSIGPVDAEGRLWVGTTLGAGYLDTRVRPVRRRAPRIVELRMQDARGTRIADEDAVDVGVDRVDVEAIALTHQREDETRYRFLLDGAVMHPTAWVEYSTVSMVGLAPGPHVLRVVAADFDGRVTPLVERRFRVVLPPWRRPWAYVVYAALTAAAVATLVQRRAARARRRLAAVEANERRLAASEQRFRRLFEAGTAPQLLVVDGVVRQANAAATTLLCADATRLEGAAVADLLPGWSDTTPEGGVWEGVAQACDDTIVPVEVRHARIPLEQGALDHLELRDLRDQRRVDEERRALEARLRESQRLEAVGTLAGGVAHDFNNLLTVIHSNAEMAAADVVPESEAATALGQLLTASTRAREVVKQILTFSRRAESRRVEVSVSALLRETRSLLRATIPSTVRLDVRVEAPDALVLGDPTQLQQLLLNLCANAEHAMRATGGGTLTVVASWREHAERPLQLRVSDTGVGMTDEVRARMFEPFFTTKPVGEGTGLGLSVLHGIVGAHGGEIAVRSAPGVGTTVDVFLPATRAGRTGLPIVAAGATVAVGAHLLLVDDDEAVRRAVERLLTRAGYAVAVAAHGAEAYAYLQSHPEVSLVITDQTMPMMTGTELAERMRRDGLSTPIVLASGYGAAIDGHHVTDSAGVYRLDKPFDTRELLAVVARALAASESGR